MATTSNFGWTTPDDTDLVKDGALAIRTLGNNIDTSLVDLKGGTTGQILSKNSNSDLDYTWINNDQGDITEVVAGTGLSGGGTSGSVTLTNTVATEFDAKGDLVVGTGADTFDKLTAGANGETLVADSSTTTGLRWQADWNTGKNKIINGDFGIWQRGTSINMSNGAFVYGADRFTIYTAFSAGSSTFARQTFTPGAAPVAGYEGSFFGRLTMGSTSTFFQIEQRIEDVRTFAGQAVTVSFWAKSSATPTCYVNLAQIFGSGGSANVDTSSSTFTLSSNWTRYTFTLNVPSISGKTIGTNSLLAFAIIHSSGAINSATIDLWGVQVEAGSVATPFTTATGTLAGELAACQRYFYAIDAYNGAYISLGFSSATTQFEGVVQFPVTMRIAPAAVVTNSANHFLFGGWGGTSQVATLTLFNASKTNTLVYGSTTGLTANRPGVIQFNNASASLAFNSEL